MTIDDLLVGHWAIEPEQPSPGPWHVKGPVFSLDHAGYKNVWVVLDVNDQFVAECVREIDAQVIAAHCPPRSL